MILEDVVAWVVAAAGGPKAALEQRIQSHGGKVVSRLGKDVSHVVWERRHSRRPSDKAADEAELLELFHSKLEKMEYPPVVVSPLWVEESLKAGRRLVERKYLVKKPTESLLGRTPGTGGAAKKRKRPGAVALPKPAEAYELDDGVFSSTQQMVGQAAAVAAVSKAAGGSHGSKQPRRGGAGARQQRSAGRGGRTPATTMLAVGEEEEEKEGGEAAALAVGTETQAVADILLADLLDEEHGRTPGGASGAAKQRQQQKQQGGEQQRQQQGEEQDELDTPLALRFAKSSSERAAGRGPGDSGERRPAAGGGAAGADRRSRLALASGPRAPGEVAAAGDGAGAADGQQAGNADTMQVDESPPQAQQPNDGQQQQQQEEEEQQPAAAAAAAKGVAARFSVRQLVQHPERPVVVHKGTPLPAAVPPELVAAKPADPIPIPVVERVTSPWTLAEQVPATQSQSQASQPAGEAAGRPSIGQPLPRPGGRRSLLAVSNVRRASAGGGSGGGSGATPGSAVPAPLPTGPDGKLPTPWSSLRPWDGKVAQAAQQVADASPSSADENRAAPPPPQHQQQQQQQQQGAPQQAAAGREQQQRESRPSEAQGAAGGSGRRSRRAEAAPAAADDEDDDAPGPSHGCIALTSVDGAVVDLARSATRRLRGLRLCPEGREEGQVTHLVVGDERRTVKLMLAVASGAWLLSPQWVTASLEAGRWLPESRFPAKVRFQAAAERARSLREVPDAEPLLAEHAVYVHLPEKARKLMGANAAALRRVATALGAKVVPPKSCSLCVVVGGGTRPPGIPKQAQCVKEEWLLQAAERYEQLEVEDFVID